MSNHLIRLFTRLRSVYDLLRCRLSCFARITDDVDRDSGRQACACMWHDDREPRRSRELIIPSVAVPFYAAFPPPIRDPDGTEKVGRPELAIIDVGVLERESRFPRAFAFSGVACDDDIAFKAAICRGTRMLTRQHEASGAVSGITARVSPQSGRSCRGSPAKSRKKKNG